MCEQNIIPAAQKAQCAAQIFALGSSRFQPSSGASRAILQDGPAMQLSSGTSLPDARMIVAIAAAGVLAFLDPLFELLQVKPPVAPHSEGWNIVLPEEAVNGCRMDAQKPSDFF
jgi:hypothetical protein